MRYKMNCNKYIVEEKHKEKDIKPNFEDDYVVKSMGAFGRWQAIICVVVSLSRLIAMWNILSILFLTPHTEFVCKKFKDNATLEIENSTCYHDCLEYEFSQDVFEKTLISDFSLICDRAWMASFTQTVLMFGLVLGLSVFGWISDRFGRRTALILSAITNVIFMFCASFAPNYWTLTVLRFFIGLTSAGIMSITAVFTLEIVGPQHREVAGSLALMPDAIAESTLAAFAYLAPTWQVYLLEYSSTSLVIMVLLLFLPETPRWLMANGQAEKAVNVMSKAAKLNNLSTASIKDNVTKSLEELNLKENESQNLNYLDLFKTKRLSIITTSFFCVWFVTGLCYYGLSQYITVLGSNIFIVVAIMGAIQLPGVLVAIAITKIFGRKSSTICTFIVIGASMIALLIIQKESWISTMFGMIGVLASWVNFCILYLFATELYPTPIRNMGFSLSSSGSKLGATIAPFVASIQSRWMATLIFAVLPFIAAAICLVLPETKGRKLRDTVDE